jgi:hypothetical protein
MQSNGRGSRRARYCFVHAADLHLDAPVRGISLPPEPWHTAVRDAALRAWQALVELTVERDAAFLILSGGLFGGHPPTLRACVALRDGLERLRAHRIDVFIALGPEDAAAAADLPWMAAGTTVFAPGAIATGYVMRDGRCLAAVRGTSTGPDDGARPVRDLRPLGMGLDIYVLPAPLAGGAPMWEAGPAESAGDYWALGGSPPPHLPAPAARRPPDGPWVVCPGTPQGRGLEASQLGAKGCVVVEVEDGQIADVAPVAVDHVRFVALEVDVSRCADLAAIRRRLARDLDDAAKQAARPLVAEAVLRGRLAGGLSRDRMRLEAELLSALRGGAAALAGTAASPGAVRAPAGAAWWARVRDLSVPDERPGTTLPWDLRRILAEHGEALSAPLPGSRFLAQTFGPLLRQWDAETDLAAQRELVRAATALALDALGAEGRR